MPRPADDLSCRQRLDHFPEAPRVRSPRFAEGHCYTQEANGMSVEVMSAVWRSTVSGSTNRFVLLALADRADDAGYCWPGVANLARKTGLGSATVKRAIRALEGEGLLERSARHWEGGAQRSNYYRLNVAALRASAAASTDAEDDPHELAAHFPAPSPQRPGGQSDPPVTAAGGSHVPPDQTALPINDDTRGDQSDPPGGSERPPDPSVDPSLDPSGVAATSGRGRARRTGPAPARRDNQPRVPDSDTMSANQRAQAMARRYKDLVPLCTWPAVMKIALEAIKVDRYSDQQIVDALERLAHDGRGVTVEALRRELEGPPRSHLKTSPTVARVAHLAGLRERYLQEEAAEAARLDPADTPAQNQLERGAS